MFKSRKLKIIFAITLIFTLTGCPLDSAEEDQKSKTKELLSEVNKQLGMPDITNFQEKRLAKQILELRDTKISTHTYIVNQFKGCLVYLGNSVGYGLPYSVQYTNPEVYYHTGATLPQADPNGLYMPQGLSATWILLYDKKTKKTNPVYIESEIIVSPFRINHQECR